jgi:O-antigen ligase
LAICGIAGVAYVLPSFLPAYFDRLWLSGEYLLSSPGVVLASRVENWRFLLAGIADHPWSTIFGVGYKTLPYSAFLGHTVVSDNMYLSLLVETGITGLVAMLLFSVAVLASTYRLATRETGMRRFLGAWMFCFWCGQMVQMMSGDILTYWRLLPLYFSVLALALRPA